jgi:predicted membrane channel-forming protein YqfA (hemolysin III family)
MEIKDIISYFVIGLISLIIGIICINLILSKEQRYKYNSIRTYLLFFLIGIIIHIFTQITNLDQLYCDKQCRMKIGLTI